MKLQSFKKMMKPLLLGVFMCALALGGKKVAATGYDFVNVPVDVVTDLNYENGTGGIVVDMSSTETKKYFQFTMEQAGYASISIGSNGIGTLSNLGCIEYANVYSNPTLAAMVTNGSLGGFKNEESVTGKLYLEKGTYYIGIGRDSWTQYYKNGVVSVNVTAQYVTTVRPTSYETAANLTIGQETFGFFSGSLRKQYYKLVLSTDSVVTVDHRINKTDNKQNVYSSDNYHYILTLCNAKKVALRTEKSDFNNTVKTSTYTLPKGTYYFCFDANYSGYIGQSAITVTTSKTDLTAPKKPTVSTYKKNTTYVKGKGEKKATVYVKIGSKTYKSKVNSKGTFSVKVPKLKKGTTIKVYLMDAAKNKSATRTVKVK